MTSAQKETISVLRTGGRSYRKIADHLGINRDAMISFCRRNLPRHPIHTHAGVEESGQCRQCGRDLVQQENMKRRVFCCKECRVKWWSEHPEMINKRAIYYFTCVHCGKPFTAYGNSGRKYCSHECYIADRFGE